MLANAAGPVMTVYLLMMRLAKYEFMGTSAWFCCIINLIRLPFSYSLGVINLSSLGFNLILLPAVAAAKKVPLCGLYGLVVKVSSSPPCTRFTSCANGR
jgi:hypothetical protein